VRVTQLVFGPYSPFPVAFRVMGPDPGKLRDIAEQVRAVMQASPQMRTVNADWGERVPTLRFALDQDSRASACRRAMWRSAIAAFPRSYEPARRLARHANRSIARRISRMDRKT